MKKATSYIIALTAIFVVGCQQQEEASTPSLGDKIRFTAEIENGIETKSMEEEGLTSETATDVDGFTLSLVSTPGIMQDGAVTKGGLVNTTSGPVPYFSVSESLGSFKVAAFNGDGTEFIAPQNSVTDGDTWGTSVDYYWNTDDTKSFAAYANLPSYASVAREYNKMTLTVGSIPSAAADQKDILLAYSKLAKPGKSIVPLTFMHPMTAVRFVAGSIESPFTVKSVTLSGIYSSGTVTQTGSALSDIAWSGRSGSASTSGTPGEYFILIPQNLATKNVSATIVVNDGSKDVTIKSVLNSGEWRQGCTNTYTINYAVPNLSVTVDYTNSGTAISAMKISKTGIKAYVRAAVTAYMCDASGLVHRNVDFSSEGTLTGLNTTDWLLGTDGFFYYSTPVSAEINNGLITNQTTSINPLFSSYTFPVESGLHGEIHIAVQAAQYTQDLTGQNIKNAFN